MFCLICGGVTQPSASTVSSSGFRRKIYLLHAIANNIQFTKEATCQLLPRPAKPMTGALQPGRLQVSLDNLTC
jgi:hypothetical protein